METIQLKLKIKPLTIPGGIINLKVKDHLPGPHSVTCECGNNFAAFRKKDDENSNYTAFRNSIQMLARSFMRKSGIIRPLAGALCIDIIIGVKRPQYHFNDDGIIEDYKYRTPMKLPAYYRIMESVTKALHGVTFTDMKQIDKASFSRVYRETDCVEIIIKEVNPSDIDPDIKQLELF